MAAAGGLEVSDVLPKHRDARAGEGGLPVRPLGPNRPSQ
jgi:hypothetical protein